MYKLPDEREVFQYRDGAKLLQTVSGALTSIQIRVTDPDGKALSAPVSITTRYGLVTPGTITSKLTLATMSGKYDTYRQNLFSTISSVVVS